MHDAKNKTWLLLDANYLCCRVRYTMRGLSFKNVPTSIVYGFMQTIQILQHTFKTENIAFCFDSKHSKRREMYPEYKANRKHRNPMTVEEQEEEQEFRKQLLKLRKFYLPALGYKNIFMQSGYEADDIIAKICCGHHAIMQFIIVTADQDLFQCLKRNVRIFNPVKHKMWTSAIFKKTYKIRPVKWTDVKAIAGCSSDNIKGIKGVGEKTVLRYLRGELQPTTQTYKKIAEWEKAEECKSNPITVNFQLVCLPFPGTKAVDLKKDNVTNKKWNTLCRHLGIKSLRKARV